MASTEKTEIVLYVIGMDESDAQNSLVWDDAGEAEAHAEECGDNLKVFSVTATIDWSTIDSVPE